MMDDMSATENLSPQQFPRDPWADTVRKHNLVESKPSSNAPYEPDYEAMDQARMEAKDPGTGTW